jgi:pimeloyl-ACP methyl ester carboxylesterase
VSAEAISTHTIEVPGGTLVYDVRPPTAPDAGSRPLVMIGHPMGASGFAELATLFPDRTVVTYDPRGCDRSEVAEAQHTPRVNADDVHLVIQAVGGGPVDVFGSSGGAVTGLELVASYPQDVAVLVAHEPPVIGVLPDAELVARAYRQVTDAYRESGFGAGMARFIALTSVTGEFPHDFLQRPAPDPALFGLPTGDDGSRDNVLLSGVSDGVVAYQVRPEELKQSATRIVIAAGAESRTQMPGRAATEIARLLGSAPVLFPSHHGGFVGGEGPHAGQPAAFAATLREVLDGLG